MRPLAVACTAIHGVFDMTEQFRSTHLDVNGNTAAEKYLKLSTDVAYIKHIRWFGPPNGTAISCKFGAEVNQWDAENALIVQVSRQTCLVYCKQTSQRNSLLASISLVTRAVCVAMGCSPSFD